MSATIEWERVERNPDYDEENPGDAAEWIYTDRNNDRELFVEFMVLRSPGWGDAPYADTLEKLGVIGWAGRGAGNADTYGYILRPDEYDRDEYEVALVDIEDLATL